MDSNQIVYPRGQVEITLAANESIAVYTQGKCQVYRELGYPNLPATKSLLGTVSNGETVFGPYTSGATIILEAGAAEVAYETGLDPVVLSQRIATRQGTPGVLNATGALTAAMMLSGIVTSTTAAAVAGTVPTGAVMDTEVEGMQIGTSFDWSVITTGANAFTVTAAASGHTLVGNMVVAAGKAGLFRTRKTAAATYVTYSLANT
jgi:hypothetical protein